MHKRFEVPTQFPVIKLDLTEILIKYPANFRKKGRLKAVSESKEQHNNQGIEYNSKWKKCSYILVFWL